MLFELVRLHSKLEVLAVEADLLVAVHAAIGQKSVDVDRFRRGAGGQWSGRYRKERKCLQTQNFFARGSLLVRLESTFLRGGGAPGKNSAGEIMGIARLFEVFCMPIAVNRRREPPLRLCFRKIPT